MVYDIIVGRDEADRKKLGTEGTILLGKHYVTMGQTTSLSNPIYLDVVKSHVIFVCGKRGGGKSYSMGIVAEGIAMLPQEIKKNLSIIILDTMGIYWTMKYANAKDESLLREWDLKAEGIDVQIYTPTKYHLQFKEKDIPTDFPFSIKPSELDPEDWFMTFDVTANEPIGILIERIILEMKETRGDFSIKEIIDEIKGDMRADKATRDAAENRFWSAQEWGIFSEKGTPLEELIKGGQIVVLDLSCYATMARGWQIKALAIGLVAKKLFNQRMTARRTEEFNEIHHQMHYFGDEAREEKKREPLVWLVVDEAHEFLPKDGKTAATDALVTILREGRQPGISLILASQQPGKIHTDVMTQSDVIMSHRVTAKIDTDALGMLMQSYMREGLDKFLNELPRVAGAAVILDDSNERIYPMRVRPRISWHGGGAPTAFEKAKKTLEF
ncbi:MAG: ATP-binding protein [Candidatus Woesearchaeota archaeon]